MNLSDSIVLDKLAHCKRNNVNISAYADAYIAILNNIDIVHDIVVYD